MSILQPARLGSTSSLALLGNRALTISTTTRCDSRTCFLTIVCSVSRLVPWAVWSWQFRTQVLLISDATDQHEPLPPTHSTSPILDLFTDGAALDSKLPAARLVSWGVVLASLIPGHHSCPVAFGGLPGILQTVGRAELCGIIAALKFGRNHDRAMRIWCDNQYVVHNARRIARNLLIPHALMPDHDLWSVVAQLLSDSPEVQFIHVGSHQSRECVDDFQQWAFDNNDAADALAGRFHEWSSTTLLKAQREAANAIRRMQFLKQCAHRHFVKVAEFSVTHKATREPRVEVVSTADPQLAAFDVSHVCRTVPYDAPARLRFDGWTKIVSWMEALEDRNTETQWVALAELLWSFQLHSGCRGVLSTGNHCTWRLDNLLHEYDGQQAIRSFGKYVVHLIQTKFPDIKTLSRRPRNFRFQMWTMCLPLRFAPDLKSRLHDWLGAQLGNKLLYTVGKDVAQLPPAIETEPSVVVPSFGLHRYG